MTTSESQTIIDSWDYLCYVKNTKRNKVTNSESFISSGVYNPSYQGIMRIGERVSVLDSTYDLVEYTVLVLKPNIRRLYTGPFAPTSVSLNV